MGEAVCTVCNAGFGVCSVRLHPKIARAIVATSSEVAADTLVSVATLTFRPDEHRNTSNIDLPFRGCGPVNPDCPTLLTSDSAAFGNRFNTRQRWPCKLVRIQILPPGIPAARPRQAKVPKLALARKQPPGVPARQSPRPHCSHCASLESQAARFYLRDYISVGAPAVTYSCYPLGYGTGVSSGAN